MSDLTDFLLARIADDEAAPHGIGALPLILNDDGEVVAVQIPPRWKAECEAKRRIVRRYEHVASVTNQRLVADYLEQGLLEAVLSLAAIWSDHPEYREEWKP